MNEWISAKDASPRDGQKVITIDNLGRIETATYHCPWYNPRTPMGAAYESLDGCWRRVTHWMPLPAAPKEEGENT